MATFDLKKDAKSEPMRETQYVDFTSYLYQSERSPVRANIGKILALTDPGERYHVVRPSFQNGFIGAIFQAYNEHRHLVLRPDDVWLAITTALGLYVNNHSEQMRDVFVEHQGKMELNVSAEGSLETADWKIIADFSDLIMQNSKGEISSWIELNFSTTTTTIKTVGQAVLMGVMKNYFDYKMRFLCGLPKVTLEGTVEDWEELRRKARKLKNFHIDCLTHWAALLDPILSKFVDSRSGKVDVRFWSRICHSEGWGSSAHYLCGWINVFIPFREKDGKYKLKHAKPFFNRWCRIDFSDIPRSTVDVPLSIDNNGVHHKVMLYSGHIVCVYNDADDTLRPSLDWVMADITNPCVQQGDLASRFPPEFVRDAMWQTYPKPTIVKY